MPLIHSSVFVSLVAGTYLHLGVFRVSLANFLYLLTILVLLVLALVAPFPHGDADADDDVRETRDVHLDR